MVKIRSYLMLLCLSLFLVFLLTIKVQAIPIGGITKIFKGLGKGTKSIKSGSKNSINDIFKKTDNPESLNSNKLLDKNSTHNDILEAHGHRSTLAVQLSKSYQFSNCFHLIGGLKNWKKEGLEL